MAKRPWTAVVLGLASFALGLAHAQPPEPPNAIDYSMFFLADVRDSPECVVTVGEDGGVDYGSTITNPAVSCPDAFAWSTFIDVGENAPYVVMDFATEQGGSKEPFLLLSFHISTKDLPSWFWATFEHVDNQGRCDWTGCNDSLGFLADGPRSKLPPPAPGLAAPAPNFTPPHQADAGGRRLALLPAQGQPDRLRHADRPRDASRQLGDRGRIHQLGLLHQLPRPRRRRRLGTAAAGHLHR